MNEKRGSSLIHCKGFGVGRGEKSCCRAMCGLILSGRGQEIE